MFTEKSFQNMDAALQHLKDLGLIDIINQAIGSIVLVTPADAKAGFNADRVENFTLNHEYNNTRWYINNAAGNFFP
jgi:hypothetical protein